MSDFIAEKPKKVKDPLFHIVKRPSCPWWRAILVRIVAVFLAVFVVGLLSVILVKENPIEVFSAMIEGTFGTSRRTWIFFQDTVILLGIALAVTPAFKMKFWNIGAEGQVLVSSLAVYACDWYLGPILPKTVLLIVMLVTGVAASVIWAVIPAIFKAQWNTNETLFTLMMNYVAIELVLFFDRIWCSGNGNNYGTTTLPSIKYGMLPEVYNKYLLSIIVVVAITVFMFIYLKYTKHGYEISVVGESKNTAQYIGINVKKVIIRTLVLSGAICGIIGFLLCSGIKFIVSDTLVGGQGFTAIIVSWMAKFNPIFMVLTALIVIFLNIGAGKVVDQFKLGNAGFGSMIVGIVFFFIIGCEFFLNYKIVFKSKRKAKKGVENNVA